MLPYGSFVHPHVNIQFTFSPTKFKFKKQTYMNKFTIQTATINVILLRIQPSRIYAKNTDEIRYGFEIHIILIDL